MCVCVCVCGSVLSERKSADMTIVGLCRACTNVTVCPDSTAFSVLCITVGKARQTDRQTHLHVFGRVVGKLGGSVFEVALSNLKRTPRASQCRRPGVQ